MLLRVRREQILLLILFFVKSSFQISCKDERNKDVDWYINYKIPKIADEPTGSDLGDGTSYAYITAPGSTSWKLSANNVLSGSMLENTMRDFYSNKQLSQEKRGGGALCFVSSPVVRAFDSVIADTDQCLVL